jgi:hypothetical protein
MTGVNQNGTPGSGFTVQVIERFPHARAESDPALVTAYVYTVEQVVEGNWC